MNRDSAVLYCVLGIRVLGIQSQSKEADVQKRVLQTMVMVVTWKSCEMKEDTIAQVRYQASVSAAALGLFQRCPVASFSLNRGTVGLLY